MEEGKKVVELNTVNVATYHSEVRLEKSPTAIGFSDSCPCCGNKKRRCLLPAASFRKKLLILDSANPDPINSDISTTASLSLTPPPPPFRKILYDSISPMTPPKPPVTPIVNPPPAAASSPSAALEEILERSKSTLTEEKGAICTDKEGKKVSVKNDAHQEEVRFSVRCRCGVVRRILLVR